MIDIQIGSTTQIQQNFKINYMRAGRIMDQLEEIGVVGPFIETKAREVLVKDTDLLVPIFANLNNSSNINTSTFPNQSTLVFTKKYYDLLIDFSKQVSIITKKLTEDSTLIEKFKDKLSESTTDTFIPYCIHFDFCQILKIICNGKICQNSLETFGLILLSPKIITSLPNDYLKNDFESISASFLLKNNNVLEEIIIEISEKVNPLTINIEYSEDKKLTSAHQLQGNLSLPTALKIIDHPLFDEYTTTLFRFANIIAKAEKLF